MSKFYIVSEEEIYNMHGYADQSEWDEPEIFRKEILNPAYEVEFDGDLREFVREKIKSDKNVQDLMEKLAATPRAGVLLTTRELEAVNKAYEEKRKAVKAKLLENMSESDEKE